MILTQYQKILGKTAFIMKTPNKRELQQVPFNHSLGIEFKDFINISKIYTAEPYYFSVLHQIILYVLDPTFEKRKIKTNYGNW